MADPYLEEQLAPLRISVKEQGDLVRSLKEKGAPEIDVKKAVVELKARKKKLEDKEIELLPKEDLIDRLKMEDLLKRRFFFDQSFSIYGGITGLYDFGPMGCAVKTNMLSEWRKHFVLEENMLEVDCAMLTPEPVLKASGHVDRFSDFMVKDTKTGECFRADHLIKQTAEKMLEDKATSADVRADLENICAMIDGYSRDDMDAVIKKYAMKSPTTGNDVSEPIAFNLMFPTSIGPTGAIQGYLRPETAQGIFVNFKRLLEFNQGKLPFAAAQIGNAFRNEISPRQGLLRVREFTMAEIEHFVDPTDKSHAKFAGVADTKAVFFSGCNQMDGKGAEELTFREAVDRKMIANETLGYYMARVQLYLLKVGIDRRKLRFRQHLSNEMAHYACDCWDAECLNSYGWIESVGIADRSCYDLTQHANATNQKLVAEKKLPAPVVVDQLVAIPNKQSLGKTYKGNGKTIIAYLSTLSEKNVKVIKKNLEQNGEHKVVVDNVEFVLKKDDVTIKQEQKQAFVEEIVPSVIEPSFGIGRVMYSIFEHNFKQRQGSDEARQFIALPPLIAPIKCSVLPLSNKPELMTFVTSVCDVLRREEVSLRVDDSGSSVGKRYARTDEIGIPFGCTIDFDTVKEKSVTLRERDSMTQVRLPIDDIGVVVRQLSTNKINWADVQKKYPAFEQQESSKK